MSRIVIFMNNGWRSDIALSPSRIIREHPERGKAAVVAQVMLVERNMVSGALTSGKAMFPFCSYFDGYQGRVKVG